MKSLEDLNSKYIFFFWFFLKKKAQKFFFFPTSKIVVVFFFFFATCFGPFLVIGQKQTFFFWEIFFFFFLKLKLIKVEGKFWKKKKKQTNRILKILRNNVHSKIKLLPPLKDYRQSIKAPVNHDRRRPTI